MVFNVSPFLLRPHFSTSLVGRMCATCRRSWPGLMSAMGHSSILLRAVPFPRFAAVADFPRAGREPRFHVAVIAAFGVGDGEQKSFGAVEKSQAQHVGAQERIKSMTDAGE